MTPLHKYYCPAAKRAGIKPNSYNRRLATLNGYAAIAMKDVPGLTPKGIDVVIYLGDRWNRQAGIEFSAPQCPPGYYIVPDLEPAIR